MLHCANSRISSSPLLSSGATTLSIKILSGQNETIKNIYIMVSFVWTTQSHRFNWQIRPARSEKGSRRREISTDRVNIWLEKKWACTFVWKRTAAKKQKRCRWLVGISITWDHIFHAISSCGLPHNYPPGPQSQTHSESAVSHFNLSVRWWEVR